MPTRPQSGRAEWRLRQPRGPNAIVVVRHFLLAVLNFVEVSILFLIRYHQYFSCTMSTLHKFMSLFTFG
jgi:hypothetical protein